MAQEAAVNFPILFPILRGKAGRAVSRFLWAVSVIAALASLCAAQVDRAGLNGMVSDPSGSVLPQTHIVAVQNSTGLRRGTTSCSSGSFGNTALAVGGFMITFALQGVQ